MTAQGLRAIERRAWLRTFEHGLWDVAIGLLLLCFGSSILTGYPWLTPIWIPVALPLIQGAGTRLVVPRIGRATFGSRRQRSKTRVLLLLTALSVAGLGMLLLTAWSTHATAPAWVGLLRSHFLIVLGAIWGGALAIAAWAVDLPRLYVYGALLLGTLLASDLTASYNLGHALVAVGGIVTLAGAALFVRFVRRYPKHPDRDAEAHDD